MDEFYESFLATSPLIKQKFKDTDMQAQKDLLRHGLSYLIMYSSNSGSAKMKLDRLGETHNKQNLNIEPWMYDKWVEALLKTVERNDRKVTDELLASWKDALQRGIQHMISMH